MRNPQKREHENLKMEKGTRRWRGGGGPRKLRDESNSSYQKGYLKDSHIISYLSTETNLGGNCFSVSAETLSLESPFPKTPKSTAKPRVANSENISQVRL